MKKPKAAVARLAGKRNAKRNRRAKVRGRLSLDLDAVDDLIASWLATKPREEREGILLGRSRVDLIGEIERDAAAGLYELSAV